MRVLDPFVLRDNACSYFLLYAFYMGGDSFGFLMAINEREQSIESYLLVCILIRMFAVNIHRYVSFFISFISSYT